MHRIGVRLIFAILAFANLISASASASATDKSSGGKEFDWLSPKGETGVVVKGDYHSPLKVASELGVVLTAAHDIHSFRIVKYSHFESGAVAVAINPTELHLELSPSLENYEPDLYLDNQPLAIVNGVANTKFLNRLQHKHELRLELEQDVSSPAEPDARHFDSVLIPIEVPSADSLIATSLAVAPTVASFASTTVLRYQTFIPDASVIAPSTLCLGVPPVTSPYIAWLFDGNNRGFLPNTTNNKTLVTTTIDWQENFVTGSTQVGKTTLRGIAPLNETVLQAQADSNLMSWSAYGPVTSNSIVNLHTEAANPFCPGIRPIYANVTGSVSIQGGYSFSGTFRQVPNHEFYVKSSLDSSWRTIFRADNSGFQCLTPIVDWCNVSGNWTPSISVWYK